MTCNHLHPTARAQSGAMLVIALVILVAMTLASIGLFRSVNTTVLLAANVGFKRDTFVRANVALKSIMDRMSPSSFVDGSEDYCSSCSAGANTLNYSPIQLATNTQGVPTVLADKAQYDATYKAAWTTDSSDLSAMSSTEIRFVIERMCDAIGNPSLDRCTYFGSGIGSQAWIDYHAPEGQVGGQAGSTSLPLFRVTVRADGPKNSVSYIQAYMDLK